MEKSRRWRVLSGWEMLGRDEESWPAENNCSAAENCSARDKVIQRRATLCQSSGGLCGEESNIHSARDCQSPYPMLFGERARKTSRFV